MLRRLVTKPDATSRRYRTIDLLRGLAALSILFWHYQHFLFSQPAQVIPVADLLRQPLAPIFGPLYTHGNLAVLLFWAISGFVFAAVYVDRAVSTKEFFNARFARLYPLHLITLIFVTIAQFCSLILINNTTIYSNFDIYHFVLNIFMASSWGFERGASFNGPIWSVSVEILIYILFWCLRSRLFQFGVIGPTLVTALFLLGIQQGLTSPIISCGFYFFAGCGVYVIHRSLPVRLQLGIAGILIVLGSKLAVSHLGYAMSAFILATILLGAAIEPAVHAALARWEWIGDNTYSLYLWHVPVQIVLILSIADRQMFATPTFLVAFIIGMMIIARMSFLMIERPLRDYLRRR